MRKRKNKDLSTDLIDQKLDKQITTERKNLTVGQQNILYAKLIDMMNDNENHTELVRYIKQYYLDTTGKKVKNVYSNIQMAKEMWLTNLSLPSLENYKKDKFLKMEQLQEKISLESEKDITDQAKVIVDINRYQDNIIGLNKDNNNDINISIMVDKEKILTSLDIDDVE